MSGVTSEETRALAGLPPADQTLLERPPLELAVAEVRFDPTLTEFSAELGLRLRERLRELGHPFAQLDRAQQGQVTINLPVGGEPVPQIQTVVSGWRVQTAGGHSQVTLLPGMVAIQTSNYERWSVSLRPLIEAALTVTGELLAPALVGRIGVRYINRFVDRSAGSPGAWSGKLHNQLLGPICHPVFGDHLRGAQQQIDLSLGDAQGAIMRHGPIVDPAADGAISYLLDIDVYDVEPSGFDPADLVVRAEYLNRTSASLFQSSLTPEFFQSLLPTPKEDAS
jgi:uncharacterized protein (TIGR04255 family)